MPERPDKVPGVLVIVELGSRIWERTDGSRNLQLNTVVFLVFLVLGFWIARPFRKFVRLFV